MGRLNDLYALIEDLRGELQIHDERLAELAQEGDTSLSYAVSARRDEVQRILNRLEYIYATNT